MAYSCLKILEDGNAVYLLKLSSSSAVRIQSVNRAVAVQLNIHNDQSRRH